MTIYFLWMENDLPPLICIMLGTKEHVQMPVGFTILLRTAGIFPISGVQKITIIVYRVIERAGRVAVRCYKWSAYSKDWEQGSNEECYRCQRQFTWCFYEPELPYPQRLIHSNRGIACDPWATGNCIGVYTCVYICTFCLLNNCLYISFFFP